MEKVCCFFGHRDIFSSPELVARVAAEVERLISLGFCRFLFGGYGRFDSLCHSAVDGLRAKYPHIKTVYVQAYYQPHGEAVLNYDETVYPGLENKPPRVAIVYRNQYMIDISDYCIFYVNRTYGGAYDTMRYAARKKKIASNMAICDF